MSDAEKAERRRARLRTIASIAAWSGWILAVLSLTIGGHLVRSLSRELRRLQAADRSEADRGSLTAPSGEGR